jgi:hypothetical protein
VGAAKSPLETGAPLACGKDGKPRVHPEAVSATELTGRLLAASKLEAVGVAALPALDNGSDEDKEVGENTRPGAVCFAKTTGPDSVATSGTSTGPLAGGNGPATGGGFVGKALAGFNQFRLFFSAFVSPPPNGLTNGLPSLAVELGVEVSAGEAGAAVGEEVGPAVPARAAANVEAKLPPVPPPSGGPKPAAVPELQLATPGAPDAGSSGRFSGMARLTFTMRDPIFALLHGDPCTPAATLSRGRRRTKAVEERLWIQVHPDYADE